MISSNAKLVAHATTPAGGEAITAETLGWQLRSALPPMRLHSVSLYNNDADVLWLSEGALGPDEHSVVIEAIESLKADKTLPCHEYGMEDSRLAIFLAVRAPRGDLVGTVMILADVKSLSDGLIERIVTPQVRTILHKIAVFLRRSGSHSGDTSQMIAMPAAHAATVSPRVASAVPAHDTVVSHTSEETATLPPSRVDEILTLELVPDAAPAAVLEPPAVTSRAAASADKPAPLPEIEVLAFEPDLSFSLAQPPAIPASPPPAPTTESQLIADTGAVPTLDDRTAAEPAPAMRPVSAPRRLQSAADTANDLTLHVQELIKLRSSGRTRRYEVLARSRGDTAQNEVPAAFVAESANGRDGAALDAAVVKHLLSWLGENGEIVWDSEPASFSVNLSIGALEDRNFPRQIAQWLESTHVPAEYIGFEVTEFACVQCRPQVQRFVEACETLGCFFVIDNFSLDSGVFEFLGSKALRHVKIDSKLTANAMKDKLPQALVVAILQACKVLGVHCVAKRIESQSALQWLTAVGCDFAQGFALEKPLPLEALIAGQSVPALRR